MDSFIEFINYCSTIFIDSTVLMLIQSCVLILILFGLDIILRKWIRSIFRYGLWMLVLIKLVLPINLSLPYSMGYWFNSAQERMERLSTEKDQIPGIPEIITESKHLKSKGFVPEFSDQQSFISAESVLTRSVDDLNNEADQSVEQFTSDNLFLVKTDIFQDVTTTSTKRSSQSDNLYYYALTWQSIVLGLWVIISMIAGLLVMQKTFLIKKLVREAPVVNNHLLVLFENCRKRLKLKREVKLRVSPYVPSPAVFGLIQPTVLIPEKLLSHPLATDEMEAIFIHELVHVQRGDLWVKHFQTILQVVYFYNPLLWLANARIKRVREMAVDESVQVVLAKSSNDVYPSALLKVAGWAIQQPQYGLRLIGVMESSNLLKERINVMLNKTTPQRKNIGMIGMLCLIMLGIFFLPMSWVEAQLALPTKPADETKPEPVDESIQGVSNLDALQTRIHQLNQKIHIKMNELLLLQQELQVMKDMIAQLHSHSELTPPVTQKTDSGLAPGALAIPPKETQTAKPPQTAALTTQPGGAAPGEGMVLGAPGILATEQHGLKSSSPRTSASRRVPAQATANDVMAMGADSRSTTPRTAALTTLPTNTTNEDMGVRSRSVTVKKRNATVQSPAMTVEDQKLDIAAEVRLELQRILPELLKEILPQILKEHKIDNQF